MVELTNRPRGDFACRVHQRQFRQIRFGWFDVREVAIRVNDLGGIDRCIGEDRTESSVPEFSVHRIEKQRSFGVREQEGPLNVER